MGHLRFLALDHKWRNKKLQFNGKKERKTAPKRLSGDDVLKQKRKEDNIQTVIVWFEKRVR